MYAVRAGFSCLPIIGPFVGAANAMDTVLHIICLMYARNDPEVDQARMQQLRLRLQQGRVYAASGMVGCVATINRITNATIHDQLATYGIVTLAGVHCYTLHIYNKIERLLGEEVDNIV